MKIKLRNRTLRLVATAAALMAGTAGVAYAAGTLSGATLATNVIQACQNDTNGNLRIVANNTTDCRNAETGISWNIVGSKGDKGDKGDVGPAGPKGETGPAGPH